MILYICRVMNNTLKFNNLFEFMEAFKDEETCRKYFVGRRFPNGAYCPHCGHTAVYEFAGGKRYRCGKCKQDFTIRTKTVFGESKLPLRKWFAAIYLLSTTSKGISSPNLAKQIGVTQKTAWFMDHRIREVMKQGKDKLFGTIEMDETYIGGAEKNKHFAKRTAGTQGRSVKTKAPVIGMAQRAGEVRATASDRVNARTVESLIVTNAAIGSQMHTDDFGAYGRVGKLFTHSVVNHSAGQYVKAGGIHTNTIESFWAIFKRNFHGIYHHMSRRHLQRYVDECAFRWNVRPNGMQAVFTDVVGRVTESKHLSYKRLTRGVV